MREVPLPRDHEGREIPLDTLVLYDAKGGEMHVSSYRYQCDVLGLSTGWNVISEDAVGQCCQHPSDSLYLSRPDSWEKLEEDVQRSGTGSSPWFCIYAGHGKNDDNCYIDCKFFGSSRPCEEQATEDIVSRIRTLRGED